MRSVVSRSFRSAACFAAVGVLLAAGVVSCARQSDPGKPSAATSIAGAGRAPEKMGQHWVQNTRLRELMKELSQQSQTKWPQGVPQDPEDSAASNPAAPFEQAAVLADALAAAAVRIPASVADVQMAEADRRAFEADATTLRDQSFELRQHATARRVEQMQRSLNAISSTCISCHSRFRDFAGQLDVQRVTADGRTPWRLSPPAAAFAVAAAR